MAGFRKMALIKFRPSPIAAIVGSMVLNFSFPTTAKTQEPSFDPALTAAGNAAKNDVTMTALRWEAIHPRSSVIEKDDFLQKLGRTTELALTDAPFVYAPIPPCFELTYQDAELAKRADATIPRLPIVDSRTADPKMKVAVVAVHVARRAMEQKDCDILAAWGRERRQGKATAR